MRQIRHKILDDVGVRQRIDARLLGGIRGNAAYSRLSVSFQFLQNSLSHTQASKGVDSVNVHRTATADALSATPAERQRRVNLVLDSDQRIQHHGASLVQIERVRLHLGLLLRLIRVPSVDVESLGLGVFGGGWVTDVAGLGLWRDGGAGGLDGGIGAREDGRAESSP